MLAAVVLAVAALTAVGFLTDRIGKAVARQANEVLAADLRLRSQDPIPAKWREMADDYGLRTADIISFPSVVFAGDESALTSVLAVSDGYPLRGTVRISDQLFSEQREATGIPDLGEVWADSALLARVGADVGDLLSVGETDLRITAVVTYRPDQSIGFASLAPTLLMNTSDMDATGLIGVGSRVRYALLIAGTEESVAEYNEAIQEELPESLRLRSAEESSERAYAAADRAKRFLVPDGCHQPAAECGCRLDVGTPLRASAHGYGCVDEEPRRDTGIRDHGRDRAARPARHHRCRGGQHRRFCGRGNLLSWILADIIQGDLARPGTDARDPGVGQRDGIAGRLRIAVADPVAQYATAQGVAPRRDAARSLAHSRGRPVARGRRRIAVPVRRRPEDAADPAERHRVDRSGTVSRRPIARGPDGAFPLRRRCGVALRSRQCCATRRASAVQVVAFGLGLTVLLLLTLVRTDLLEGWRQTLDESAPNHFLINIQRSETESVTGIFEDRGVQPPDFAPLVRARMTLINGESVKDREYPTEDAQWFVNREQNLSWATQLSSSNEILEGDWWPADYDGPPLVSIEEEVAEETGLKIGDILQFEVAGQELEAEIASVRRINWDSFMPNFFLVLSPGALDEYPATFIAAMRVEDADKGSLVDLVRRHPTISVIDLDSILQQVRGIIEKATMAVQAVFFFTLAAGIAVLFAAVQSTIDERRFESAMLRALGARKRIVFSGVMAEFAALGAAAGVLAAAGASILAAILAVQLFQLPYSFNPLLWVAGVAAGLLVVCASGYFAARSAINSAPVDVLRGVPV